MALDKISKQLLEKIAGLHELPSGAVSFRHNGKSDTIRSTANIEIEKKTDNPGINIYIHSTCQGEACHIPVVVDATDMFDMVYNDFYIEDGADVIIVAGCGVHSSGSAGHDGIHTFHVGKNAKVRYIENHLALGQGGNKILNPTTVVKAKENSEIIMETNQLGGVDQANRKLSAILGKGSTLTVNEKILTDGFNVAKTSFDVKLNGENSKAVVTSRSVARGESEQEFRSKMHGNNECYGRVECDGIVLDRSKITSNPVVIANDNRAALSHEASIGRIAKDQMVKLETLGLSEKDAETKIIEGFLK